MVDIGDTIISIGIGLYGFTVIAALIVVLMTIIDVISISNILIFTGILLISYGFGKFIRIGLRKKYGR